MTVKTVTSQLHISEDFSLHCYLTVHQRLRNNTTLSDIVQSLQETQQTVYDSEYFVQRIFHLVVTNIGILELKDSILNGIFTVMDNLQALDLEFHRT